MHTRERILTIRLLENISNHPEYAALLGIVCARESVLSEKEETPPQNR